ncbi:tyrosine-type recombinase/integrase [Streptomyces sp. NPDC000880]
MRHLAPTTRRGKADALSVYFQFLELRHAVEIHNLTGIVVQCPLDELNRQRGSYQLLIRVPPSEREIAELFQGWSCDLQTCRKFATGARNFTAARLMSQVGLRITECPCLSLDDIKWEVGRFGKVHVRYGKGSRGAGPKQRLVPLINGARSTAQWYVEDVRGYFDDEWDRPGAPLLPSERRNADGTSKQVSSQSLRDGLNEAVERHLPAWAGRLTPHVLRHFCASQMYLAGMDLMAIQELLGHSWLATTMRYVHVQRTHIEDAWLRGQQRAARRLEGTDPMKWNLRLAAANRGIWKASELQRMLAERGLTMSAGKLSGLWSGQPNSIKLDELEVFCAVLAHGPEELLVREPESVAARAPDESETLEAIGQSAPADRSCVDVAIHTEPGRPSLIQDHPTVITVTNLRGQNT